MHKTISVFAFCIAASLVRLVGAPLTQPAPNASRTMSKRQFSDNSSVVVSGQQLRTAGFNNVLGTTEFKKLAAILSYRADLYPSDGSGPVTLWTSLDCCNEGWAGNDSSQVLDVGCGDNAFILILWSGGQLWAYYHDFSGLPASGVIALSPEWTIYPVYKPFDAKVTKASLDIGKDHVLRLNVVERDEHRGRVTEFEKAKEKWEFRVVSSVKDQ